MSGGGGVLDFLNAFNSTTETGQKFMKNFELMKLAKEQETPTYTQDQQDQRAAIEGAVDSDGKPLYTVSTDPAGKTVVQSNLPDDSGNQPAPFSIASQGTNYLGKTYNHPLTDTDRSVAKNIAIAGILGKYGDTEGAMRFQNAAVGLQRQEKQDSQNDQRFDWEKGRAEREQRLAAQTDADAELVRNVDKSTGDWLTKRLTNTDGTQRDATMDDHLAASQFRARALTEAGKADMAQKVMAEHNAQALTKIQLETAERNQDIGKVTAALGTGDLSAAQDFYNKYVPDGAKVTGIDKDPKSGAVTVHRETMDGKPMPDTVLKNTDQLAATVQSFTNPAALYNWTQSPFQNTIALNADKRGDKQVQIAAGHLQIARDKATSEITDANALRAAGVDYEKARQAGDEAGMKAATLKIIQAGGTAPGVGSDKDPAEVKLANAMLKAGLATDMKSALEMAISKKGQSGDSIHQAFVEAGIKNMSSATDSVAKADEAMSAMGYKKSNGRWMPADSGAKSANSAKPASEADARKQAQDAVAAGADKAQVNARLKTMGFKPLD